jgi:hypothetical protein
MVYLAMEVRTGKTLTALETIKLCGRKNVLFLTKKKAIKSIEHDYAAGEYCFALRVSNYEQLHNIDCRDIDLFVLDEAHGLAAYPKPSLRNKRLKIRIGAKPVIYLSGTPTPESYSQFYHQLWVSDNSPYRGYKNFYIWAHEYVDIYQTVRNGFKINEYDRADAERIKADLKNIIITYSQQEAQFVCPVEERFLVVSDPIIPQAIKEIFRERILKIGDRVSIADTPAALLSKMHQLSGGTIICDGGVQIISEKKAEYIKENFADKKIVVFYKFIGERTVLDRWFPDATESPEEFQAGESRVFLSQICSGREGLALSAADCIVMYNIDFAAVSYFQARARLQDLKRDTPAIIYWLFFEGSIERRVYKAVSAKKDFTLGYFVRTGAI